MQARKIHDSFHSSFLKSYKEYQFHLHIKPLPPVKLADGSEEHEADSILVKQKKNGEHCILLDEKVIPTRKTYGKQMEIYQTQSSY